VLFRNTSVAVKRKTGMPSFCSARFAVRLIGRAFVIVVTVDLDDDERLLAADLRDKDRKIHAPNAGHFELWH
jgi:hypothetical protein